MALSLFLLSAGMNYYLVMAVAILLIINFELARNGSFREMGITKKRLRPAIKIQLPFTLICAAGLIAFAFVKGCAISIPHVEYLTYWLASVPMQELLFRGYAQGSLRGRLPTITMVLLVAAIFSLFHYFAQTPHFPILMAATFVAGLAWGLAYEKERNLLGPIFSHLVLGTLIFLVLPANGI